MWGALFPRIEEEHDSGLQAGGFDLGGEGPVGTVPRGHRELDREPGQGGVEGFLEALVQIPSRIHAYVPVPGPS